eukprot:682293-Pelagomonas_calceolata.AAC.2
MEVQRSPTSSFNTKALKQTLECTTAFAMYHTHKRKHVRPRAHYSALSEHTCAHDSGRRVALEADAAARASVVLLQPACLFGSSGFAGAQRFRKGSGIAAGCGIKCEHWSYFNMRFHVQASSCCSLHVQRVVSSGLANAAGLSSNFRAAILLQPARFMRVQQVVSSSLAAACMFTKL